MEQTPTSHHIGKLSIEDVIKSSLRIYFNNFLFFILLSAIAILPFFLFIFYHKYYFFESVDIFDSLAIKIICLAACLLTHCISAYVVSMQLNGQFSNIGDAITYGKGSLARAIATGITLYIIGITLCIIGITLCIILLLFMTGLNLFHVLVCSLALSTTYSVPASSIEKIGPIAAIKRHFFLMRGYRWKLFGINSILALATLIFISTSLLFSFLDRHVASDFRGELFGIGLLLYFFPSLCINSIAGAYIYHVLSIEKNGLNIDKITNSQSETT